MKTVIGMDLGDKSHFAVVLDGEGNEVRRGVVNNTRPAIRRFFAPWSGAAVVIEAGTHSMWISRLLESMDLEVCVANPRSLPMIWKANDKSDKNDARKLAQIYRAEPSLLDPIRHRGEQAQKDMQVIKSREALVGARTKLVNHVRGSVKSAGGRIPSCDAGYFHTKAPEHIPCELTLVLLPMVKMIETLTEQIKAFDKAIEVLCRESYPETEIIREIGGVGPVTALSFRLVIDDPSRFAKSRLVGAYLGLTPKRDQSGQSDKQLRITKAGDKLLRKYLVNAAHSILGRNGRDCDLRRHGERIMERGGKNGKKRAAVAVARKLANLMHRLWVTGAVYDPFMNSRAA